MADPSRAPAARIDATYRLQLHAGFGIGKVERLIPYLHRLGVSHLYVSPILRARAGSTHGYDQVDPTRLNPELGTESDFEALVQTLRRCDMGLVLDIVPNHMATGSENPFWEDVLTHGRSSRYARWFDIDWGGAGRRVFLPVLGQRVAAALDGGEITLTYAERGFRVRYHEHSFPIDPATIPRILQSDQPANEAPGDELEDLLARLRALPPRNVAHRKDIEERAARAAPALEAFDHLYQRSPEVRARVRHALAAFGPERNAASRLRDLLDAQAYRLAFWRRAAREINYRRFFTVSHLVALRQEDPEVFTTTHGLILRWVSEGKVDGLRIDHVDGLLDPEGYLEQLQAAIREHRPGGSRPFPILVEKILARSERLPNAWPVMGTTGYDFLNQVEDLFLVPEGYAAIGRYYRRFTRRDLGFADVGRRAKRRILTGHLSGEVSRLVRLLRRATRHQHTGLDLDHADLAAAIVELIVHLPVYRTYLGPGGRVSPGDRVLLERALTDASATGRATNQAFQLLTAVLLMPGESRTTGARDRESFVLRLQQLSVPAAAKGIEDTAFYAYVPLASRNEVGNEPDHSLADAVMAFHRTAVERVSRWPAAMLCTSTHDTKRSADARARLDVLSEVPELWDRHVRRWRRWNAEYRTRVRGRLAPDANTEYLLYQSLVGIWPLPPRNVDGDGLPGPSTLHALADRVDDYLRKAIREAKEHTSWVDPDPEFEAAVSRFVRALLVEDRDSPFLQDLTRFVVRVGPAGLWNTLSRTLIHLTAPGVPDLYQGDELWNYALVDPDNRRPVDFERRARLLEATGTSSAVVPTDLPAILEDGRLKLLVVHRALQARRNLPQLFPDGSYLPLECRGPRAANVMAFARTRDRVCALTVAARHTAHLSATPGAPPVGPIWAGTSIVLPDELGSDNLVCALSGRSIALRGAQGWRTVQVAELLAHLPIALLIPQG